MRFYKKVFCNPCTWHDDSTWQVYLATLLPIFLVPILMVLATQSLNWTIFIFFVSPPLVFFLNRNFLQFLIPTQFFFMWAITSVIMLLLVFELAVVPLLEILPEENLVFVICVMGGIVCSRKTRKNAYKAIQENSTGQRLEIIEDNEEICNICKKFIDQKTFHCNLCDSCIIDKKYHCKWLNCCISTINLQWYIAFLFFSAVAFLYGSNLSMTTVCQPYIFIDKLLLPYDCSDVYYQFDVALSFVSSIYSLIIGLVVLFYFFYHLWILYVEKTTDDKYILSNKNDFNEDL